MNNQINNEKLLEVLLKSLKEVSEIIVVRSEFGDIIYCSKDLTGLDDIQLSSLNQKNKEYKIGTKIYKLDKEKIEVCDEYYDLEIYSDNTQFKELKTSSETDYLTSLINRRGLELEIAKAIKEFEMNRQPFAVVMGDVDKFKNVNDKIGHTNGDIVLRRISSALKSNVRNSDVVGRYGGEEFLIILKSCDSNSAYEIVEKMRKNISEIPFEKIKNITMSFGISVYDGTRELKEVIEEADKNMYESKSNGRNMTTKCGKTYSKIIN